MDIQRTMEFLLQQQARVEVQLQAIGGHVRDVAQKQSKNETLVHQLTLMVSQLADRQAKQFRQLADRQTKQFGQLTAAQKKTDAQLQELSGEVRSLVAAIRNFVSANGRKRKP